MTTADRDGEGRDDAAEGSERAFVVMEPEVAEELADLLEDRPGEADEDLLDEAADALEEPTDRVPGPAQRDIAKGDAVAVKVERDQIDEARSLIETDHARDPGLLGRFARALRQKARGARKKQRQDGRDKKQRRKRTNA